MELSTLTVDTALCNLYKAPPPSFSLQRLFIGFLPDFPTPHAVCPFFYVGMFSSHLIFTS